MADSDKNNELDAILRQLRQELGAPRAAGRDDGPPSDANGPIYGDVQPVSPQPRYVQVRLPTGQVRAAWVLLTINVVLFVITHLLSLWQSPQECFPLSPFSCALRDLGWKENELIDNGQYWRLLTAMFLHGNLLHIFFNGYALYILGPETERIYGTLRFLALYFLAGLSGSIASYAFSPAPSVGASGAIFGLVGGLAVFYYLSRDALGDFGRNQLRGMIAIVIINLLIGFSAGGIIDNYAHVGGLIGGAAAGWFLAPRYTIDRYFFPPVIGRRFQPLSWIGAGGMLLLLVALAIII